MSNNVYTMAGAPLQTVAVLADWLKEGYEEGRIKNVVMVIERHDGFSELAYNRQSHGQVVFASQVLNSVALKMAESAIVEEDHEE